MPTDPAILQQLRIYVRGSFEHRIDEQTIQANLLQAGWDSGAVEEAISKERPSPHRIRNGVLWIASPFIVLAIGLIVSFSLSALNVQSAGLNIFSLLIGLAGTILLIVGPILGIVILARR